MYTSSIKKVKKLLFVIVAFSLFSQMQAQNDLVSIRSNGSEEFIVSSTNGIPFTVVLEESNNDGQFHLSSGGDFIFKKGDLIGTRSTVRIVFEEEMYHSLEDKLIEQYDSESNWIKSRLDISDAAFKMFPTRPVFTDAGLEKLKSKVFEYANTQEKEAYFNQWIEKINYSVGAVDYFRKLYAASNGEDNEQRRNFLPINIHQELQKNR